MDKWTGGPRFWVSLYGLVMNISKSDWKLFRERLPGWQERFMNRFLLDYAQMISSDGAASDRFWALDERLKQDKKSPGVLMSPSKSELPWDLARMIRCGVISSLDLDGFSEELMEGVKRILELPI